MKIPTLMLLAGMLFNAAYSQTYNSDSVINVLKLQKDSTLKAIIHDDSIKTEKKFANKIKWEKIKAITKYPVLNAGDNSGIVPVNDLSEIPDPNLDYKLLFELTGNNRDSMAKEINYGLAEVSRVINLHVASGIPVKKILPVVVIHAGALNAFTGNTYFKDHFKMDNPNLKIINELENLGTKFIACGQAMAFFNIKKEDLLPAVKVSLTAQTVLTAYQLKGYVWMEK